jgi:hypothetical protein
VNRRGSSHLRTEIDSNGFIGLAFVHRGPITYSIISASVEPFITKPTVALGLGLGARAQLTDGLHLDFEGLAHVLLDREISQDGPPSAMFDARILVGGRIAPGVKIYGGLGIRTHLEVGTHSGLGAPVYVQDAPTAGSPRVRIWPTITGGVELF